MKINEKVVKEADDNWRLLATEEGGDMLNCEQPLKEEATYKFSKTSCSPAIHNDGSKMSLQLSYAEMVKTYRPVNWETTVNVVEHTFVGNIQMSVGTANKETHQVILKVDKKEIKFA